MLVYGFPYLNDFVLCFDNFVLFQEYCVVFQKYNILCCVSKTLFVFQELFVVF